MLKLRRKLLNRFEESLIIIAKSFIHSFIHSIVQKTGNAIRSFHYMTTKCAYKHRSCLEMRAALSVNNFVINQNSALLSTVITSKE